MSFSIYPSEIAADTMEAGGAMDVIVQNALYRGSPVPSPGVATYQVPGLPAGTYWVQNDDQAYVMNALLFVVPS